MAIRDDFLPGEILAASDLNDTFAAKLAVAGGKILQIVRATDATERTTTSTSFVDVTGMAVTITPQKSDSAVVIIASFASTSSRSTGDSVVARFAITDSSGNAFSGGQQISHGTTRYTYGSVPVHFGHTTAIAHATPATTSPVTFKLRFVAFAGTTTTVQNNLNTGQMYAIEVSA